MFLDRPLGGRDGSVDLGALLVQVVRDAVLLVKRRNRDSHSGERVARKFCKCCTATLLKELLICSLHHIEDITRVRTAEL